MPPPIQNARPVVDAGENEPLLNSEQFYRALIADSLDGMLLLDPSGTIIFASPSVKKILGYEPEDIKGRRAFEFVHPEESAVAFESFQKEVFQTAEVKFIEVRLLKQDGEWLWCMVRGHNMLTNPHINGIIIYFHDDTGRRKLQEELVARQISHQRQLTQASIDGQENERREIGKELHDNIGQQLTTIKLFLDLAKNTAGDGADEMVALALKGVSDVINDVRSISRSLTPPTLKDLGLIEALNELIDSISRTQLLTIHFDVFQFDESILPENQKLTIFRMVQEQLNNIVRHADARQAWIELRCGNGLLMLQVRDNGNGFDPSTTRKGLGLINIENRAELFNGRAEMLSEPGRGCVLQVSIPMGMMETGTALISGTT